MADSEQNEAAPAAKQVDWAPIKQRTSAIAMTALCFFTFVLIAGASTEGPRGGAINVLLWALSYSVPASAVVALVTALVLRQRQLR